MVIIGIYNRKYYFTATMINLYIQGDLESNNLLLALRTNNKYQGDPLGQLNIMCGQWPYMLWGVQRPQINEISTNILSPLIKG